MAYDVVLGAAMAGLLLLLIWRLRGVLLTPVPRDPGQTLTVTVAVRGRDQALEQTVQALLWLRENGTLPAAALVLKDEGMEEATGLLARRLARRYGLLLDEGEQIHGRELDGAERDGPVGDLSE